MKPFLSVQTAAYAILGIFGLLIIFHILAILGIIPMDMIWGGRLTSRQEVISMELMAIAVLLAASLIVAIKSGFIPRPKIVGQIGIWLLVILFSMNTLGNLMAISPLEKYIFTPVTLLLALLALRIALGRKET